MIDKDTFKREYIRMMDSIRREGSKYKGTPSCEEVINCDMCPLQSICAGRGPGHSPVGYAFEFVEAVEKWSQEHPFVTMEEKFKEMFGIQPIEPTDNEKCCPRRLGFAVPQCSPFKSCYS